MNTVKDIRVVNGLVTILRELNESVAIHMRDNRDMEIISKINFLISDFIGDDDDLRLLVDLAQDRDDESGDFIVGKHKLMHYNWDSPIYKEGDEVEYTIEEILRALKAYHVKGFMLPFNVITARWIGEDGPIDAFAKYGYSNYRFEKRGKITGAYFTAD